MDLHCPQTIDCLIYSSFGGVRVRRVAAVLLELIMKGFQANTQNFRSFRFVVAGGFQRLEDQHFFRLAHGGAHSQTDRVRIIGTGALDGVAESGRQMFGFDHAAVAHNHSALNRVAQLADISRPGIVVEQIHHGFADGTHLAGMLRRSFLIPEAVPDRLCLLCAPAAEACGY